MMNTRVTAAALLNHQPLRRNFTIVLWILYIKAAMMSSIAFCHTEKHLLSWKQAPSSSAGLRLDLCSASWPWNGTGERSQFQQRADRFWTAVGIEWLVVRRMSQASCAELARDGGGVLNGFILHYYGQCGFAYKGNKHASVSGSQLSLMLTSWNYLV